MELFAARSPGVDATTSPFCLTQRLLVHCCLTPRPYFSLVSWAVNKSLHLSRSARQRPGMQCHAETTKEVQMQLKVLVTSDRPDEYVGKKGLVKNQVITCQDVDPSGFRPCSCRLITR